MNSCPYKLKPGLPPLTKRLEKLPVDERGYPVPWFVTWINGKPEFRSADARKWSRAVKESLCWVCGEKLGRYKTFAIGPMCAITRSTSEPANHLECAEWSVRGCPFLSKPAMARRDNGGEDWETIKAHTVVSGIPIDRNPGVTCLWTAVDFKTFRAGQGRLIEVGDPVHIGWYREGRPATHGEVMEAIRTGLPLLEEQCEKEHPSLRAEAYADVRARLKGLMPYLPKL